ncbi:MAG: DUF4346 domain-containing protein [Candidatus Thermoplasmatota archaeon]
MNNSKKDVPLIEAEKKSEKNVKLDPKGFFVIEIDHDEKIIRVEHFSNVVKEDRVVSGCLQKVFVGRKADALCDTIASNIPGLYPEHYMYLGRELQKAEYALEEDKKYVQGGC